MGEMRWVFPMERMEMVSAPFQYLLRLGGGRMRRPSTDRSKKIYEKARTGGPRVRWAVRCRA
jgi:hypothetical protein